MNTSIWRRAATSLLSLSLILLAACYPLALVLPSWWSYENQPIENAQVILIGIGFAASLLFFRQGNDPGRWFGLAAAPVLLVLIGRELSWGAVFFDPTSIGDHGPLFASRYLWYKPAVAPAVAALILSTIAIIVVKRLTFVGIDLLKQRRIPLFSMLFTAIGMLISTASEGHLPLVPMGDWMDGHVAQLVEELSELCAYLAMIAGLFFIFSDLSAQESGGGQR
ncbi:hypothetical protein N7E02_24370 [Aliirhizobium terrae]|uniref:hypothetical protein n=1 Tax=Terrirhizobium terrae TaxID=2926709 RepID=UPI002577E30F|nr:hypothetical protein [Rhizobium sp. CC-CFT758]WJH39827.1 hypothetical protein N7E02_24370 [Rhizobium sp. CC-CFT758]